MRKYIRNGIYILAGAVFYAVGISLFLDPNDLAPGGVIGISVILNRMVGMSTGTWYFILNIPIVLLGIWKFGAKFMTSTFVVIVLNSALTNVLAEFPAITTEPLLACLSGGILIGAGIGMIFRAGTTTGGTDIIVKVIKLRYKHLRTGFLFMVIDLAIVAVSGIIFKNVNIALYAFIAVFVSGRTMDRVLYGSDEARLVYIISKEHARISQRAMEELDIGMTLLAGEGAYSRNKRDVILCVVRKQIAPGLEDIVKEEDPAAFLIITSASEIYGEGYKNILGTRL